MVIYHIKHHLHKLSLETHFTNVDQCNTDLCNNSSTITQNATTNKLAPKLQESMQQNHNYPSMQGNVFFPLMNRHSNNTLYNKRTMDQT